MSEVRELTVEEGIKRLDQRIANANEMRRLRAEGDSIVRKAQESGTDRNQDIRNKGLGIKIFIGIVVSWGIALSFNLPLVAIVGMIGFLALYFKISAPNAEEKQLNAEYEQRVQEAMNEKKKYEAMATKLYLENNKLINLPAICQSSEACKMMRMFLESGQASTVEMALYMTEKEMSQRKQQNDMQRQLDQIQQDVQYATQAAQRAEHYAKYNNTF